MLKHRKVKTFGQNPGISCLDELDKIFDLGFHPGIGEKTKSLAGDCLEIQVIEEEAGANAVYVREMHFAPVGLLVYSEDLSFDALKSLATELEPIILGYAKTKILEKVNDSFFTDESLLEDVEETDEPKVHKLDVHLEDVLVEYAVRASTLIEERKPDGTTIRASSASNIAVMNHATMLYLFMILAKYSDFLDELPTEKAIDVAKKLYSKDPTNRRLKEALKYFAFVYKFGRIFHDEVSDVRLVTEMNDIPNGWQTIKNAVFGMCLLSRLQRYKLRGLMKSFLAKVNIGPSDELFGTLVSTEKLFEEYEQLNFNIFLKITETDAISLSREELSFRSVYKGWLRQKEWDKLLWELNISKAFHEQSFAENPVQVATDAIKVFRQVQRLRLTLLNVFRAFSYGFRILSEELGKTKTREASKKNRNTIEGLKRQVLKRIEELESFFRVEVELVEHPIEIGNRKVLFSELLYEASRRFGVFLSSVGNNSLTRRAKAVVLPVERHQTDAQSFVQEVCRYAVQKPVKLPLKIEGKSKVWKDLEKVMSENSTKVKRFTDEEKPNRRKKRNEHMMSDVLRGFFRVFCLSEPEQVVENNIQLQIDVDDVVKDKEKRALDCPIPEFEIDL